MKTPTFRLTFTIVLLTASSAWAWPIRDDEAQKQNENFQRWWGTELVWQFDELPVDGSVLSFRYPYSGAIYPDNVGGTAQVLRKYDRAFNSGRSLAESFEYRDIRVHQEVTTVTRRGLFGRGFQSTRASTPYWAGHCNGWAAAAIRHAEPVNSVTRNGVEFTPSDIKGLLAELYVYSEIEHLGGLDRAINPGTLHVVLSNWLGRNQYPIAMDSTVGKEVWNYPIYAYRSASAKRGGHEVEVKINVGYVNYTNREYDKGPENYRHLYFHYALDLDDEGKITGGTYYNDSNRLDILWVPLLPVPGGEEGNEPGNPHLAVNEVLALWRDSAPQDLRAKWFTIDPAEEDRVSLEAVAQAIADEEASEPSDEAGESVEVASQAADQDEPGGSTEAPTAPGD